MQTDQDKIKVVIVDDEPQSILRLENDLAALEDFEVIATSSSAMSANTLVMSMQPDVLFIDVEMPGQTGFEVLQSLRDEMPMDLIVVFYSAFNNRCAACFSLRLPAETISAGRVGTDSGTYSSEVGRGRGGFLFSWFYCLLS